MREALARVCWILNVAKLLLSVKRISTLDTIAVESGQAGKACLIQLEDQHLFKNVATVAKCLNTAVRTARSARRMIAGRGVTCSAYKSSVDAFWPCNDGLTLLVGLPARWGGNFPAWLLGPG